MHVQYSRQYSLLLFEVNHAAYIPAATNFKTYELLFETYMLQENLIS